MDWQIELLKALVEMVKTGGSYAIWGIIAWWVMNLCKVALVGWVAYSILKLLVNNVNNYISLRFLSKQQVLELLPRKVAQALKKSLEDYQEESTKAMKSFIEESKDLIKKSKETNITDGKGKPKKK